MQFKPGQSGNPNGRPRGAAGLARYIAEQTQDGRELVDRLLVLSRTGEAREANSATLALLDRLVGKPMQPSEMHAQVETVSSSRDWSQVPLEERRALLAQLRGPRPALPRALDGDQRVVALALPPGDEDG